MFERRRNLNAFKLPVIIIKESWTVTAGKKFRGIFVNSTAEHDILLSSNSFLTIKSKNEESLAALTIALNSTFAVYYLFMTSGRLASYRPSLRNYDLKEIPLPQNRVSVKHLKEIKDADIDPIAFNLYKLNAVERHLIYDFYNVTLRDFKDAISSPGRDQVITCSDERCGMLEVYCKWFIDVLLSGFGRDKQLCASIFVPKDENPLPFCIVGIHLEWINSSLIRYERISNSKLLTKLQELDESQKDQQRKGDGIYYKRVSRIYNIVDVSNEGRLQKIPTVFLIKPNRLRYWTRSMALRDADEVSVDIFQWSQLSANGQDSGSYE